MSKEYSSRAPRHQRIIRSLYDAEPLERRMLLSTYVINGTSGNNHWFIDCSPGSVRFNGNQVNDASITDVQINGFDGQDSVVIQSASIPVVFNAGNHDDWISLTSGNLTPITATLTFNGASGFDYVEVRDVLYAPNTTYTVNSNNVFERATGHGRTLMDAGTESLRVEGGGGSNAYYINNVMDTLGISLTGGATGEQFNVDMTTARNVSIDGGDGADFLSIFDFNRPGGGSYYVGGTVVQQGGSGGQATGFTNMERLLLQGSGNGNNVFEINDIHPNMEADVLGWNSSDTFNVKAAGGNFILGQGLTIAGFGGSDSVTYNATNLAAATIFNLSPGQIAANAPRSLVEHQEVEQVVLLGPNNNSEYFVHGTSAQVTNQTTIYAGNGSNSIWIDPRDPQGNFTLQTHVGVFGQGGSDTVFVNDLGSALPIDYVINNVFIPTTANIGGFGPGLIGAASDVENITIFAGDADDTFKIETFKSGNALTISAGGGDDALSWTPTAKNLIGNITSMSFFSYGGDAGADSMTLFNDNSTSFNYTRTSAQLRADRAVGGYTLQMNHSGTESVRAVGGGLDDTFRIKSTATGTTSTFEGGGGNDFYHITDDAVTTQSIRGAVRVLGGGGGNDWVLIDDSNDTVGRTLHVSASQVGATAGDNLFAGGYVEFDSITGSLGINCGSGTDTAYVTPHPITPINVDLGAQNLLRGPGDSLNLAFADAVNPVLIEGDPGEGTYTFDNRAPLTFSGVEQSAIDDVAPTVDASAFNVNAEQQSITIQFSEDVSSTLSAPSLTLNNLTTNETIDPANFSLAWNPDANSARFTFPGFDFGALPDGNYRAILSGAVSDLFGNPIGAEHELEFFFLQGDANCDGRVNLNDFNILAANFGEEEERTFSQGDFNYDGRVNLADYNILAGRFGAVLGPDGATSSAPRFGRVLLQELA